MKKEEIAIAIIIVFLILALWAYITREKDDNSPQYDFTGAPINDAAWEEWIESSYQSQLQEEIRRRAIRIKKIRDKKAKSLK